ncbi:MAG: TonB family protein [Pyrinomonadaceae bacterium]
MGKIVKYCGSCDEGFAEKFGYCPNCANPLQAFEMNPVEAKAVAEAVAEPPVPAILEAPVVAEAAPVVDAAPVIEEPIAVVEETIEAVAAPEIVEDVAEPVVEAVAPKAIPVAAPVYTQPTAVDVDRIPVSLSDERDKAVNEGGFYVTVIEEKNASQRSMLLLGSTAFILVLALGSTVFSLFQKDIGIGAIGNDSSLASLIDEVPMITEEEPEQKKDKDAGGGGGGGREEEETTKGDLANQTQNPQRPPQAIPRMENPSLVLPPASTQGNKTFEQKYDRFGDPNGRFSNWNNGSGTGGGQGNGSGTGQGSGIGTGAGSGTGSGYGSGLGNGNGNGTGDGDGGGGPPPRAVGVTQGIKILSKPRPGYTDSARQNNITGTVILRVTFLASGQVGSISPVKGLGNGLTEQAIAAARRISFEPAKTNGVPQSVTKQIEYTFSIY